MCSSMDSNPRLAVGRLIQQNPLVGGLAIVIGNRYSRHPGLKTLSGPPHDVQAMCEAFKSLHYATLAVNNATRQDMLDVIRGVLDFFPSHPPPLCYQRLVFAFAGHGDDTDSLHTDDGVVSLKTEVIKPLLPGNCQRLERVTKLFFIDACRSELPTDCDPPQPRGGKMPPTAGYYLAQSTQWSEVALEKKHGGCWMQLLAEELQDPTNLGRNIQSIVSKVNRRLTDMLSQDPYKPDDFLQQPLDGGTLHEDVRFVNEAIAFSDRYGGSLFPQQPAPPVTPSISALGHGHTPTTGVLKEMCENTLTVAASTRPMSHYQSPSTLSSVPQVCQTQAQQSVERGQRSRVL